jgi:acetyltransferase
VKLAQLAADLPEVLEIDINPFLVDERGVVAVDARVSIARSETAGRGQRGHPRFAIRPYPKEWEKHLALKDGTPVFVRPIRPDDEHLYERFFANVTNDDLRLRFFAAIKTLDHVRLARFTQIDYARAMAFIAIDERTGDLLGVARIHADANYDTAEYAILIRSDFKARGLGRLLMQTMLDYARAEGLRTVHGQVLAENTAMLQMCKELGFHVSPDTRDPATYIVRLTLN